MLEPMIEAETKKRATKEWLDVFEGSGLPYAAVNDVQQTLAHEHVLARGMIKEVEHPACGKMKLVDAPVKYGGCGGEVGIRTPPPTLGEHTDEVLSDVLGMEKVEVDRLKGAGVVA